MTKILYNFPTRERPNKCFNSIENIISQSKHDDYLIMLTLDIDDPKMNNESVLKQIGIYGSKVIYYFGLSKNKVDAINKNVNKVNYDWDIVCSHSDDMRFIKPGFDLSILKAFENFSGLVHFPDQKAKERTCTYPMMTREYYNIDGWIYHPSFDNVYCDNFQHALAKKRNSYKFVNEQIIIHEHAMWGFGQYDDLLKRTENPIGYDKDRKTFERLKIEYDL